MALRDHTNSVFHWFIQRYKSRYVAIAVAAILVLFTLLLNAFSFMQEVELKTLDYRFAHFSSPSEPDSNIVLVAIDNRSLSYFKEFGISWPWPRDFYAHLLDYFTAEQAEAVLFDLLFYEQDLRREETGPEVTDGKFAGAVERNGKVVLGAQLELDSTESADIPTRFAISTTETVGQQRNYHGIQLPIDTLLQAAQHLGITNIYPDPDGIIRRVRPIYGFQGEAYPGIVVAGLMAAGAGQPVSSKNSRIMTDDLKIPLQQDGSYLVNWYGPGGSGGPFTYVTCSAAIQSASARLSGGTPSLEPGFFRDKFVIIGATAPGLLDLKPTPYSKFGTFPGMEIWATVLSNILQQNHLQPLPLWMNALNTLLVCFLVLLLFTRFQLRYSNMFMLGILGYIFGVALLLWQLDHIWVSVTMPATGFLLSYVYIATVSFVVEGRSKLEIRKVFSRYVHPDVIQNLLEDPDRVRLGGDEIYATVMFSDIYNFTTFSEGKTAPELVTYLNDYFNTLTGFVLDHNGLLDKYTGDGIMALFGAPVPREDHALQACRAALAHRSYSEGLADKEGELTPADHFHMHTRIGLNSGSIVAGNIGSERRTDYTAIGDDVNLAARLEGVNKVFQTKIIISETTFSLVREHLLCRELDMLRVKGKREPVKIYEVMDFPDQVTAPVREVIERYEEGLRQYRNGDWTGAMHLFGQLVDGEISDAAAQTMLNRCKILQKEALTDWDGIYTLETK